MIKRWLNLKSSKSSLLIGVRRAGKSTLLKMTFPDYEYVTLDDFDIFKTTEQDPKALFRNNSTKIIVDEVQRNPKLLIEIKNQIDNFNKTVFMTGSSTLGLLSHGSETLAGRIKILECPTLCFGEDEGQPLGKSLEFKPTYQSLMKGAREFKSWLNFGGFPEIRTKTADVERLEILKDYKNTFFTKELLLLSNIENARGLMGCMNYLAISIGSRIDVSSIAKESGLSHPTAKKYLGALEASRLAFRLTGYQFGPAKRQLKSSKYYYADTSIPRALGLELSQGQWFELFVIGELEKRRKLGRFNCDFLYYYESEKGNEIDLIIDEGHNVMAIEIKSTDKPGPSDVTNLLEFKLTKPKATLRKILICNTLEFKAIKDVEVWPVSALYQCL